jgi:cellulose biosynthesis protein BcsQ
VTENSIVLEKIPQSIDLDEFLQKIEQIEPDPNQPTLEEISDIVKEVRQEIWTNK